MNRLTYQLQVPNVFLKHMSESIAEIESRSSQVRLSRKPAGAPRLLSPELATVCVASALFSPHLEKQ